MNIKKALLLLLAVVFIFSCKQEELLDQSSGIADLTTDVSKYDNSNLGIYKGAFTTLDAMERGVVEVKILDNVSSRATLTLSSGATYVLRSTSVVTSGQDTNLSFVAISESALDLAFTFSVNSNGTNIVVTNTTLGTNASHILLVKETSRGVALTVPGTYACTDCGSHPTLGTGPQTFNVIFVSDPQGEGSSTLETQFTLNGEIFTSPATDNSQDGASCADNGDFTTCNITGSTTIGANAMTWTGTHTYNNTAISCSEMSGIWMHPGYGGISGTFVSDIQCIPALIGETRDGGVVFWVDPTDNTRGLVCAFSDFAYQVDWGCYATDLPNVPNIPGSPVTGPGTEIGDGITNTNSILLDCPTAPAALAARSLGPDWFLPSIKELNEMYENKVTLEAVAGFSAFEDYYWSSTETNAFDAWQQYFDGGASEQFKLYSFPVRAVRAFPPPPPKPAAIGDFRNGGVVFWVDPTDNTHGLVCAISNAPSWVQWGCNDSDLSSVSNVQIVPPSGPGAEVGDGVSNTNGILTDCPTASAALAARLLGSEWFLPSINELSLMYEHRDAINAAVLPIGGGTFSDDYFWSSTEYDGSEAWGLRFDDGSKVNFDKNFTIVVRAVRAF